MRVRRQYQLCLRTLLTSSPWQDVAALLLELQPDWSYDDENTASLVDLHTFWLEAEYVKWTTSPEEAKKATQRAVDPPPMPLIRPVAKRPPRAHAAAVARYEELNASYSAPTTEPAAPMSPRELAARFGLAPMQI